MILFYENASRNLFKINKMLGKQVLPSTHINFYKYGSERVGSLAPAAPAHGLSYTDH
jgi:hypothetical protein